MPKRSFSGLITEPPKPLPDDDDDVPAPASEVVRPLVEVVPRTAAAVSDSSPEVVDLRETADEPVGTASATEPSASEPTAAKASVGGSSTASAPAPEPVTKGDAANTIRLHQGAANALNDAWLDQRMHVDPKLSKPAFASEIVRLGLAAFESRAERS